MTTNNTKGAQAEKQLNCATRSCRHWHNESKFNCEHPSLIDNCACFAPELTAVEKELLRMLKERAPMWPFDEALDTAYVRKLHSLYGAEINLVEKFFLWESYYSGKPACERTNPRLAFHKWCIRGVELKKKYAKDHPPIAPINADLKAIKRPVLNPRESVAGVPAAWNIHDLAAGIVREKTPRMEVFGHAPDRVKKILVEASMNSGLVRSQQAPPTQEELEERKRTQLLWARGQREEQPNEG